MRGISRGRSRVRGRGQSRGRGHSVSKMSTRLSTGTLVMSGTSTTSPASTASPLSDSKPAKAVLGSKRQLSLSESPVPVPPKQCKIVKDGKTYDPFCWLCHKPDCSVACPLPLCPRSFHSRCLMLMSVPSEWACPECEKIIDAGCMDTRSRAMGQITIDTLSLLLRYALDRMRQPGSEVFQKPADETVLPNYSDVVVNPMDFSKMQQTIKEKGYGSTVEFLVDAKWILHNCIIYNGLHHKLTNVARQVVKSCKHEMAEIEVCPQCYKMSCISEANWFIEPCDPPHPLVWAKLKGYPFWPAKAMEELHNGIDVRFFGAHDKSVVPLSQVFLFSKEPPTAMGKKKAGFITAMDEIKEHINIIRKKYSYNYAPFRTPYVSGLVHKKETLAKPIKVVGRFGAKKDTEKLSVTSKTASAVKSKYSSMFSRKFSSTSATTTNNSTTSASVTHTSNTITKTSSSSSTSTATPSSSTTSTATPTSAIISNTPPSASNSTVSITTISPLSTPELLKRKPGRPKKNPVTPASPGHPKKNPVPPASPDTAEKAIWRALRDCGRTSASKSAFINPTVKITDIIQQKLKLEQVEVMEKEVPDAEEEMEEEEAMDNMEEGVDVCDALHEDPAENLAAQGETADGDREECEGKDSSLSDGKHAGGDAVMEKDGGKHSEKEGTGSEVTEEAVQETDVDGRRNEDIQGESENNIDRRDGREESLENGTQLVQEKLLVEDSLMKETVGPKSGTDYRDSLKKTIEACKGKLGISDLDEVDDAMDRSDDDDDSSKDDARSQEVTESQASTDTQDSRTSLDTDMSSTSAAIPDKMYILGSASFSSSETNSVSLSVSETSISKESVGSSCSHSEIHSEQLLKSVSGIDSGSSLTSETQDSTSVLANFESSRETPEVGISDKTKEGAVTDTQADAAVDSSPTASLETGTAPSVSPASPSSAAALATSGTVVTTLPSAQSKTNTTSYTFAKQSVSQVVITEKKIAKAASILNQTAENMFKMAEKTGTGVGDQTPTLSPPISPLSHKKKASKTTPLISVSLNQQGEVTTCSENASPVSEASSQKSSSSEVFSGNNLVNPITIADYEELGLHMEVETEVEIGQEQQEEPILIDLSNDDDDNDDDSTMVEKENTSLNSSPKGLVQHLATSPSVVQNLCDKNGSPQPHTPQTNSVISQPQSDPLSRVTQKRLTEKKKALSANSSPSSMAAEQSFAQSSLPAEMEQCEMVISEVRSLSGTLHDWKESNINKQSKASKSKASSIMPVVPEPVPPALTASPAIPPTAQPQLQQSFKTPPPKPSSGHLCQGASVSQPSGPRQISLLTSTSSTTTLRQATTCLSTVSVQTPSPLVGCREATSARVASRPVAPPVPTLRRSPSPSNTVSLRLLDRVLSGGGDNAMEGGDYPGAAAAAAAELCAAPEKQTLTPAAVSLVNKYSQQIMGNMQQQLAEMSRELLASACKEKERQLEQQIRDAKEQLQVQHARTVVELQHNHNTTIAEMKACWASELTKAISDTVNKLTRLKEQAVAETKKKQWCAHCWKEALYYCCWNTSYCTFGCQQSHWQAHRNSCRQMLENTPASTPPADPFPNAPTPPPPPFSPSSPPSTMVIRPAIAAMPFPQGQRFTIHNSQSGSVNIVQGAVQPSLAGTNQPVQQTQLMNALRASQQVHLLGQRPVLSMIVPTSVLPLVPGHIQPTTTTSSTSTSTTSTTTSASTFTSTSTYKSM